MPPLSSSCHSARLVEGISDSAFPDVTTNRGDPREAGQVHSPFFKQSAATCKAVQSKVRLELVIKHHGPVAPNEALHSKGTHAIDPLKLGTPLIEIPQRVRRQL